MNYILQKANCKALIVALFVFVGALLSIRSAYAYDRVYIYTSGTFNLENTFIPSLTSIKQSYALCRCLAEQQRHVYPQRHL